jgi:hypothetical protein
MRRGAAILAVALIAAPAGLAAQAPDENYLAGRIPEPTFPPDAPLSLVTGRLASALPLGSFACPDNHICLDSVWEDTFRDMETRLGPAIDPADHVRSIHDAGLAGDPVVAYVVRRDGQGRLWAIDIQIVRKGRACFGAWLADEWPELASHRRAGGSENKICLRVR